MNYSIFRYGLALALAVGASGMADAQSKISSTGRSTLARYQRQAEQAASRGAAITEVPTVGVLVRTDDKSAAELLLANGYTVASDFGNVALVNIPITEVERVAEIPAVRSVSLGGRKRLHMDKARELSGVDEAYLGMIGDMETTPYTGRGVILGLMDGGLYPNHINFQGRVERLWHFSGQDGTSKEYTASTISTFTTDDKEETHATHVAGIMSGGYTGSVTYRDGSSLRTAANPYYGVAPEATLAFSCGELYDANILQGVQNIVEYAESQGMPAAINLSLGQNAGPHDGTDDFSAALNALGERALICISAGNEGDTDLSIEKTFTASDKSVKTILFYNNAYVDSNYGYLDIWADDERPLTVTISNINSSGTLSNTVTVSSNANGQSISKCVKSGGSVDAYAGVDANNGRYNVLLDFYYALPKTGRFAISVSGAEGQTVNMYFDGYSTFTNRYSASASPLSGYTAGSPDMSINDMVCGPNVLSVGAYTSRRSWGELGSTSAATSSETVGDIASFSSYGHDFSGRQLPEITAPGTMIISSFSPAYIDGGYGSDYGEDANTMTAKVTSGSTTHYWGSMQGTSMSCPFVTGTMALWLQADPSLTIDDVRRVLMTSSMEDDYTAAAPNRFGYGKINAERGLQQLIGLAGVDKVYEDDAQRLIVTPTADGYEVFMAGASALTATLYDLQGRPVATAKATDGKAIINASQLPAGLYLLEAATPSMRLTRKLTK